MQNPVGLGIDVPRRAAFFGTLGRLDRAERRLIRLELKNPWQTDGETLDCESVRRFIGWCGYYRISFKVLFNARGLDADEECEVRVFPGAPFPRGHPTMEGPSHLFEKVPDFDQMEDSGDEVGEEPEGVYHLVMWGRTFGEAPKWKTAREYRGAGDAGYPRVVGMNDTFSSNVVRGGALQRDC